MGDPGGNAYVSQGSDDPGASCSMCYPLKCHLASSEDKMSCNISSA